MTISNKDKKLLVYLVAVGIIALVYFFVARPNLDKQQDLATEVLNLRTQVEHYSSIYNNRDDYENKVAEAQTQYGETLNKFFVGLNQENTLINIKDMEDVTNTWISRVSFQESQIMMGNGESGATLENEASADSDVNTEDLTVLTSGLTGMKEDLNLDYSCSYSDFKRLIEYIQNYDQRLFITSINASYSPDTNQVTGTMVLSQYAILGTDREYSEPDLTSIETGVGNIFSTLKGATQSAEIQNTIETLENPEAEENAEIIEGETSDDTDESTNDVESSEQEEEEGPPPAMEDGDNGNGRRNLSR